MKHEGLRYNEGKIRYDLIPTFANQQFARVLGKGAEKYGEQNWEKGMAWSSVIASLKRHIAAFESGEDFDAETGLLHMAHAMCNVSFLLEYYKIYPQGDDRPHTKRRHFRIGLDIDEVLADWVGHWMARHGYSERPEFWDFDRHIHSKFEEVMHDKEFWMTIPCKTEPTDIPFEPHCYITSRCIPVEWTEQWLDKMGFPGRPVYSIPMGTSKVTVAKKAEIEIYVDDRYDNFVQLNQAGICCFLFDAPHNQRYDVGFKRIKSLKELGHL